MKMDQKKNCSILEKFDSEKYFFTQFNPKIMGAEDIESFLKLVDGEFKPKLTSLHNLFDYAEKIIKLSDAVFVVSRNSNTICAINVFYLSNRKDEYCHWSMLAVSPEHRGQRLGKLLTECMIMCCELETVSAVLSQTWSQNTASINLHLSNGFEICGKSQRPGSDDYTLKLRYEL